MPAQLTLWLISATNEKQTYSQVTHVYAADECHAMSLAQEWLAKHPDLPHYSLRMCPNGFQFGFTRLPGHQVEDAASETAEQEGHDGAI